MNTTPSKSSFGQHQVDVDQGRDLLNTQRTTNQSVETTESQIHSQHNEMPLAYWSSVAAGSNNINILNELSDSYPARSHQSGQASPAMDIYPGDSLGPPVISQSRSDCIVVGPIVGEVCRYPLRRNSTHLMREAHDKDSLGKD